MIFIVQSAHSSAVTLELNIRLFTAIYGDQMIEICTLNLTSAESFNGHYIGIVSAVFIAQFFAYKSQACHELAGFSNQSTC